jgi:hypothetical protein
MIVDRKEFKKFWKGCWFVPNITFCNDQYYIPTLKEINQKIIPEYKAFILNNNLQLKDSWSCSKFSQTFKLISDMYNRENNNSHISIAIAHIKLKKEKHDHALNFIIYHENFNIKYTFFEPQNLSFIKDEDFFKNLEFLYF